MDFCLGLILTADDVDDEPKDGPDHYIILSGFYSPGLFNYIDEFCLPADCIIKFKSPNVDLIMQFLAEIENREKLETNLKTSLKISSEFLCFIWGLLSLCGEIFLEKTKLKVYIWLMGGSGFLFLFVFVCRVEKDYFPS